MCMQLYCPLAPWQERKKKWSNGDCFVCFLVSMWSPKMSVLVYRERRPPFHKHSGKMRKKTFGISHTSLLRCPGENFVFGNLRISRVFSKFDGGFNYFEIVKKPEQLQIPCSSANAEDSKKIFLRFLLFLTKILVTTSPKFVQIISSVISRNLFYIFFRNTKKIFSIFFIYAILMSFLTEGGIE